MDAQPPNVVVLRDSNHRLYTSGIHRGHSEACLDVADSLARLAIQCADDPELSAAASLLTRMVGQLRRQGHESHASAERLLDDGIRLAKDESLAIDHNRRALAELQGVIWYRWKARVLKWFRWHVSTAE